MITRERAYALRKLIEQAATSLDDATALEGVELFPNWKIGVDYKIDDRVREDNILYKCLQNHTSIENWNPSDATSLWAKVLIPDPEVIPDWEQPISTNPYMKGDKVRHIEKIWISLIDNNIWEPGSVGTESLWQEIQQ